MRRGDRAIGIVFAAGVLAALTARPALAEFNGEVLVAPPPPNWSGGSIEETADGIVRTWRRILRDRPLPQEKIVVSRTPTVDSADPIDVATRHAGTVTEACVEAEVTNARYEEAEIGTFASVTARCTIRGTGGAADLALFSVIRAYIGEFNIYAVERTWTGDARDPGSPANSPRTAEAWMTYFDRISVCNTLVSTCDPADAEIIHADPRFQRMRALPVVAKPVMPQEDAIAAARGLGELTGRADACGEDITPLTSKIGRMFAYVTANDSVSSAAVEQFERSLAAGREAQSAQDRESCGPVLREFRAHPTRVGAFHRYVERFL